MARQLSVVLATYNRREILRKTLEAHKRQTAADEILEVLVVDDGSTDGTEEAVAESALVSPFPIRVVRQENRGLAAARNLGIRSAQGEILLFGDDDIIPTPTMVAEHLAWNKKYPAPSDAILGHVAWSPEVNPTPFMEWLGLDGVLLGYGHLSPGSQVGFRHFYVGNMSVKKSFLLEHGMFDESFRTYGYEDTELGYRLMERGLRLFYNPDAIGLHYKHMSLADVRRRIEMVETASKLFYAKVPASALWEPAPSQKVSLRHRTTALLVPWLAPVMVPFAPVLDTQIPLPWSLYRIFYYHVIPRIRTRHRAGVEETDKGSR